MSHHGDAAGIEIRPRNEIVHGALQTPRPGGDRAPIVRPCSLSGLAQMGLNPLAKIGTVGVDVAAIERGDRIQSSDRSIVPVAQTSTWAFATFVGGLNILDAGTIGVHPDGRQMNLGIGDQRVIAAEVQANKNRRRPRTPIRRHEKEIDRRRIGRAESESHFPEGRLAAKALPILASHRGHEISGT